MFRVLKSIPGARVERNAIVPLKEGGVAQCAFRVALGDSPTSLMGALGMALQGKPVNFRLFFVQQDVDGSFFITINEDLSAHREIKQGVLAALSGADEREEEQRREEVRRKQEEELRQGAARKRKIEEAQAEAGRVLARMDAGRQGTEPAGGAAPAAAPPPGMAADASAALQNVLAQQYARERVLEQLETLQKEHGVSLGGIETLQDGTIEITLRG